MEFLALGIIFLIGIIVGRVFTLSQARAKTMGWLRIDRSEPEEPPRPFLELKNVTLDMIAHEKFIQVEVVNIRYISHN